MKLRYPITLMAIAFCGTLNEVRAIHPAVAFAGEYLLSKAIDEGFDRVSGKPDLKVLNQRLRELETNAAMKGDTGKEIRALREGLNERVTKEEFQKRAAEVSKKLDVVQKRLDDVEIRLERVEAELADAKAKTSRVNDPKYFLERAAGYERERKYFSAIGCYQIAADLAKPTSDLYWRRARVYLKMGAPGVAAVGASEALELDDKNAAAYGLFGFARLARLWLSVVRRA